MKLLNFFLDIDAMQEAACQRATEVAEPWDILQGQPHPDHPDDGELYIQDPQTGEWYVWPHDLRDTDSRYYRTQPDEDGHQGRVSGRMLANDLVQSSASAATPVLFGLIPLFTLVLLVVHGSLLLSAIPGLLLLITLGLISTSTDKWTWTVASGLCVVLPLLSLGLIHTPVGLSSLMRGDFSSMAALVPLALIVGLAFLFGSRREARLVVGVLLGLAVLLGITAFLPPILRPLVLLLPACALPVGWGYSLEMQRIVHLEWQAQYVTWEDSANGTHHIEARRAQTLRAAKEQAA
jgi:hypothetical protein